jgi:hypothetical protein
MTDDARGLLSHRTRWVLGIGCVVVLFALVAYAGVLAARPSVPAAPAGQVRLGPEPGEAVASYVERAGASWPTGGERVFALVQLGPELSAADAAAVVGAGSGSGAGAAGGSGAVGGAVGAGGAGVPVAEVVFRVEIPRVQTALRFLDLPAGAPVAGALDTARQQAGHAAEADAARLTDRPGAVAEAEAAAYATPCACVLALLVQADRPALEALAAAPGVRAVEAAPPGVGTSGLALSPLLPEQTTTADPPPDDGPA